MPPRPTLLWLRHDLRLADHPALIAALRRGGPVLPAFIWAPEEEGAWPPGAASRWWLHHSLAAMDETLRRRGSRLVLRRGPTLEALRALARESGAEAVHWSRRYEPAIVPRDAALKTALQGDGLAADSFNAALLFEPWTVQNRERKPYQVFTSYWRHCQHLPPPAPALPAPRKLPAPRAWPRSTSLAELELLPRPDWAAGLNRAWEPGEAGAARQLKRFLREGLAGYPEGREALGTPGPSRLSPHLHFGEIGPRQVWRAVAGAVPPRLAARGGRIVAAAGAQAAEPYLRQLAWREFAHHLLYHFPHVPERPLRPAYAGFPWREDEAALRAWQRGRTGYPVVDAGMRELWATGWMHNRARMTVASFLVKHLLLPWQEGARWFWDTLVDADLANNTLGWQWAAGCGADAAPFFRIFHPVAQGERFDPRGDYVRRWVPELAGLPAQWIHEPWEAPAATLEAAGVRLGENYPRPVVDHAEARRRALAAMRAAV